MDDRDTLRKVLAVNALQAIGGALIGLWAGSAALLGAALDNAADAGVYGLSLHAVGRPRAYQARAARISGWLLIALSTALLVEVLRRFLGHAEPVGPAMMAAAAGNAAANLACLKLLRKHRGEGVHFDASWIFTSNDMLINLGIVLSGALVMHTGSPVPDLAIGLVTVAVAFKGGREILEMAREARA